MRRTRTLVSFAMAAWAVALLAGCTSASQETRSLVAKEDMCSACHGRNGQSVSVRAPILAGQPQAYLVAQLTAFRDHSRADSDAQAYMWPMAAGLTDPMIESLASYFSALPPAPGAPASEAAAAEGKTLYDKGAVERGIPPCATCHGDKAQGMAAFPRLAGQHADYLNAQLAAFAENARANPIMSPIAKSMSPGEIQSIAAFLATQ
jgi:cytochrome c553